MNPVVVIGTGALILLVGAGIGFWFGSIGRKAQTARASELQEELNHYRRKVSGHFGATAVHLRTIGNEYRRLYEHMAEGAGALCEPGPAGRVLFEPLDSPSATTVSASDSPLSTQDYDIADRLGVVADDAGLIAIEPSDEELAETEAAEEFLAEREFAAEDVDPDKTYH